MNNSTYNHLVKSSEIKDGLTKLNLPLGTDILGVTAQGASRLIIHYKLNPKENKTREREFFVMKEGEIYESPYAVSFVAIVTRPSDTVYIFEIL